MLVSSFSRWLMLASLACYLGACTEFKLGALNTESKPDAPKPAPTNYWTEPQRTFLENLKNNQAKSSKGDPTAQLMATGRTQLKQCNDWTSDNFIRMIAYASNSGNFICDFYDLENGAHHRQINGQWEEAAFPTETEFNQATEELRKSIGGQTPSDQAACITMALHPVAILCESHISGGSTFSFFYGSPSRHCKVYVAYSAWFRTIRKTD